jgi:molybdenum cofactor synthesis domain-containing protein
MAKTAGIVIIGNEVLSGKTQDINSHFFCRELRQLGVEVKKISTIQDEIELIGREVAEFSKHFDFVFTSGGIGPTHDDVTIEGIAQPDGTMHPMQAAFKECHGLQCGFCTPGMVMSAIDLCTHHPKSSETEIRSLLDGNLCRCTGYQNIVKAVKMGGEAMLAAPAKATVSA